MFKFLLIPLICFSLSQDTFSIVAVNTYTGEVGSAGASCIAGSIIISDIHPGHGAIHTQSFWLQGNQSLASSYMNLGFSPQEILDSIVVNDLQGNPSVRQYGAVDLVNEGRSAAFTGENCYDYKGHITGTTYAIQGNILLGQEVLTQMEENFLNTNGTFSEKMMASLQGANIVGADTRCLQYGTSSLSAFVRVANPNDDDDNINLDLNINNVSNGEEPIDLLQIEFDTWFQNQPLIINGDINGDLIINISDILEMINYITSNYSLSVSSLYAADINNDSNLNIQDIIITINIILGNN